MSVEQILADRQEVQPTKFRARAIKPEKKHTRNQRYYEHLLSDIDNPDSESAKARKTRFMAAVRNPDVREYVQQRLDQSRRNNSWWERQQQHPQQRQQQGASHGSKVRTSQGGRSWQQSASSSSRGGWTWQQRMEWQQR